MCTAPGTHRCLAFGRRVGAAGIAALCGTGDDLSADGRRLRFDPTRRFRALGRISFGWAQLTVILTGSIGAMAYAFGDYAVTLFDWKADRSVWLAVGSVAALTLLNLAGVIFGKSAQNVLTGIKSWG